MADKQETTLNLSSIMDEGMDVFQGELDKEAAPKDTAITPKPADEEGPPEGRESDDGSQTTDDGSQTTEDGSQTTEDKAGTELKETPKEKKDFRFKDHEAAEIGYRNAQAAMTKAEQEAARLRQTLQQVEDEKKAREIQEKNDQTLIDFMADEHEKALDAVDELDPDDDGYRKAVARIWATKDAAIKVKERELTAESGKREAESGKGQEGSAEREAGSGRREEEGGKGEAEVPDKDKAWDAVKEKATAAKIDPDDDYFIQACALAPAVGPDGQTLTFDEQVQWAVDKTTAYNKKREENFLAKQKAAAKNTADRHQEQNLPLGRSPADKASTVPDKAPVITISSALDSAMEERRL